MSNTAKKLEVDLQIDDFILLKDFVERHPQIWRTVGAARYAIWVSHENGLDDYGVIHRLGKKVYIVKPRILAWMQSK